MVSYLVPRSRFLLRPKLKQAPVSTDANKWAIKWNFRRRMSTQKDSPEKHNLDKLLIKQKCQKTQGADVQQVSNKKQRKGWFNWYGLIFRWAPMGVCIFGALEWQYHRYDCEKKNIPKTASTFQANLYCSLPLRLISRCWGWLADCYVPVNMRQFIYGLYSNKFNVNIEEAAITDLKHYRSIADFFTRTLRDGARLIDPHSKLVSPADGKVLHFGTAKDGSFIEQVKGISYQIDSFLGPNTWGQSNDNEIYENQIKHNKSNTTLYQCIIYLAPGDYHRFHSPTNWEPTFRRHFPGQLLSVSPIVAKWLPDLFCLNERAVYVGKWEHGFFSYTAVGATNVGSLQIFIDDKLKTNKWMGLKRVKHNTFEDWKIPKGSTFDKGELIGQFNMGSTIVLLFEAPTNFRFSIKAGDKIKVGQSLGSFK